jgi:seryl-tRNA(Sec) selenium transferase
MFSVSRETIKGTNMALTNAERQANLKARREEITRLLTEQNAKLLDENAALREEVATLREKAHRLEIAALKAQIKKQEPAQKPAPAKAPAPVKKARSKAL